MVADGNLYNIALNDIPDNKVRQWYQGCQQLKTVPDGVQSELEKFNNKPRLYYFATPGLGEMVQQTPLMRFLDQEYEIHLVIRKNQSAAFETLPYLKSIISCDEATLYHRNGETDVSPEFAMSSSDVVFSCNKIGNNIKKKTDHVFDLSSPFYSSNGRQSKCYAEGWALIHGIELESFVLDVGFNEYFSHGFTYPTIGVGIGSGENCRKLSVAAIELLSIALSPIAQVVILGHDPHGEIGRIKSCTNMTNKDMSCDNLRHSLSCLKKLQVFITPESGFFSCALALGVPVVLIQSRTGMEAVADIYRDLVKVYRKKNPQCRQNCIPCLKEKGSNCSVPSNYPHSLECIVPGSPVPCLEDLPTKEITIMSEELINHNKTKPEGTATLERSILGLFIPSTWEIIQPTSWDKKITDQRQEMHEFLCRVSTLGLPIKNTMEHYWFHSALAYEEFSTMLNMIPAKLGVVVEIGLGKGGTHLWLSQISRKILSIENSLSQCIATAALMRLLEYSGNSVFICSDTRDSEAKQELEIELGSQRLDFLLIDGSHRFEDVIADYDEYSSYVKKGGWIAFDDSCTEIGVLMALKEIWLRDGVNFSIINISGGQGIALCQYP